jgi:hypothetical protein
MEEKAKIKKIIPKTSRAKEYHNRFYLARSLKVIEEINSEPVTVFICGPSQEEDKRLTTKKIDTVNELRNRGHDANTGEELVSELQAINPESNMTANVYENIAAAQSELVIIFCASPGSIGETHEFLSIPDIARKTLVFIDKKYKNGYTAKGVLEMHKSVNGLVEEYEENDIEECRLLTRSVEWVRDYQAMRWMNSKKII